MIAITPCAPKYMHLEDLKSFNKAGHLLCLPHKDGVSDAGHCVAPSPDRYYFFLKVAEMPLISSYGAKSSSYENPVSDR